MSFMLQFVNPNYREIYFVTFDHVLFIDQPRLRVRPCAAALGDREAAGSRPGHIVQPRHP